MASGKTHDRAGLLAGLGLASYFASSSTIAPYIISWMMLGYGVGIIWLSPDLDLHNSRPTKRFGVFKFLALPYSKLIKHRGVSHWVVAGTLTRSIYLLPLIYIFPDRVFITAVLIGMEMSALVHLLCDYTPGLRRL